jgi:hypothetical protein
MSAQGGTLGRLGTSHLPIWPVATLLAAVIASAIALSTLGGTVDDRVVTPVTVQERFANSAASVREQGATMPTVSAPGVVTHQVGLENPGAYGISQVTEVTHPVGLENPGAYGISQVTEATSPVGLENPGVYPAEGFTPEAGAYQPIEVNGSVCGQCR